MDEGSAVIAWAFSLLTGIALVYDSQPPQNTPKDANGSIQPYIILQQQAWTEFGTGLSGERGAASVLLTVKVVSQSAGFDSAARILKSAESVIEGASGSSNGVDIRDCVLQQRIRYPEDREGIRYNHLGTIYRLTVTPQQ